MAAPRLFELIGEGHIAKVYRARLPDVPEDIAAKVLEDVDSSLVDAEIRIMRSLNHQNVVRYIKTIAYKGKLHICMELCRCGAVSEILEALDDAGEQMTETEISSIMRDAVAGVAYMHSKHILHGDIKGRNLLATEDGVIKIIDFGVCLELDKPQPPRDSDDPPVGTPYWMAPEVIQGAQYEYAADIWSLGITAIELAEVDPPRHELHPMRVLFMIPKLPPPELADKSSFWSPAFHDFVRVCLQTDPIKSESVPIA